jgi:hypothetical protein
LKEITKIKENIMITIDKYSYMPGNGGGDDTDPDDN